MKNQWLAIIRQVLLRAHKNIKEEEKDEEGGRQKLLEQTWGTCTEWSRKFLVNTYFSLWPHILGWSFELRFPVIVGVATI